MRLPRGQESETLCRKGGTSRSDNAPHASGARVGAKLACGATLSATREFAWLAWVVAAFVSPFRLLREEFKRRPEVLEIYVHTSERRGREKNFADGYEPPLENFLDIDTTGVAVEDCVQRILAAEVF